MIAEPKIDNITSEPIPARIAGELSKIEIALRDAGTDPQRWGQLYAAHQASLWATNEDLVAAPYAVIVNRKVQPPTDTQVG